MKAAEIRELSIKELEEKLQNEVVDIEEMDNSICLTDLGLNDIRMDLINFLQTKTDIKDVSCGVHTVCKKDENKNIKEGVIFVLKKYKSKPIFLFSLYFSRWANNTKSSKYKKYS